MMLVGLLVLVVGGEAGSSVHTVFPTECTRYFTWQSMGMMLSHRLAGQAGPLTRIMSCTHEELEQMSPEEINICPTHVAPSYTVHPRTGDVYSAYNKPVAVIDWLARNEVKEEYVLIIDADMIMLTPFVPEEVGASPGWAVSAYFSYMKGVNNELALKHVPEVLPRNDTLAGPRGRRGDMVGGFTLMNTEDLRRVAPLWLKYSEDVRFDPDAWTLSGDHYSVNKGDRPWISEMYGYSYGASKANVWHHVDHSAMLYPGYVVKELPKVLHYGLKIEVPKTDWTFDKHNNYDFDALMCPPWELTNLSKGKGKHGGLFPHPPHPDSLKGSDSEVLRDLLAIQTVVVLNAAFCERHEKACPPSDQLRQECETARTRLSALLRRTADISQRLPDPCRNEHKQCADWAAGGECTKNADWMHDYCALACKACKARPAAKSGAPVLADNEAGLTDAGKDEAMAAVAVEGLLRGADVAVVAGVTADEAAEAAKAAEEAARAAEAAKAAEEAKVATDEALATTADDPHAAAVTVPPEKVERLRARCTRQSHWSMSAVKACLAAAAEGREYEHPAEAANAGGGVRQLGERTRLLVVGAGAKGAGAAESMLHAPGLFGFVLWAVVLLALLAMLPRVRQTLSASGRPFLLGRRADKTGRSE